MRQTLHLRRQSGERQDQARACPGDTAAQSERGGKHKQKPGEGNNSDENRPGPGAPHPLKGVAASPSDLRHNACISQAQPLPPRGALRLEQFATFVAFAAGGTADLAAGGLEYRARRRQHDIVCRHADQIDGETVDLGLDAALFLQIHFFPRLSQHHQPLRAGARISGRKNTHPAPAHARHQINGFFQFLGVDVVPTPNDDVLLAPGEIQLRRHEIAQVASVEPFPFKETLCGLRVAKIAGGRGGAAKLHPPLGTVRQLQAFDINDADDMTGQGSATGDKALGMGIVASGGQGDAGAGEREAIHPIEQRPTPERREGKTDRGLRQAVDRGHGNGVKTTGKQTGGKTFDGVRTDRLGAVVGEPPAAQIQAVQLTLIELAGAQFIGKVRRRRDRGAVAMDGP